MLRWFANRFRKKDKSLKIHRPAIVPTNAELCNFRFRDSTKARRDTPPAEHVYEEIDDPKSASKKRGNAKKKGKKVHFLDTKFHSVSDISQIPREDTSCVEGHRRSSSLVSIDTLGLPFSVPPQTRQKPQPVKPPRKSRPGTRRWHTMLEKPENRPQFVAQRDSCEINKMKRFRLWLNRQSDNYGLERADSDSGYENSNCSSNGSDVMDVTPGSGYDYYMSKIEQLRMLEKEVDDLMNGLDLADISEAHGEIKARISSPRMARRCVDSLDEERRLFEGQRATYSRLPDPDDFQCFSRPEPSSRSCESLTGRMSPYEISSDSRLPEGFLTHRIPKPRYRYVQNSGFPDQCSNISERFNQMSPPETPLFRFPGYRRPPSGASVSRHHTVGAFDLNRSALPNKTLRDLIRNNYHRQNVVAKM